VPKPVTLTRRSWCAAVRAARRASEEVDILVASEVPAAVTAVLPACAARLGRALQRAGCARRERREARIEYRSCECGHRSQVLVQHVDAISRIIGAPPRYNIRTRSHRLATHATRNARRLKGVMPHATVAQELQVQLLSTSARLRASRVNACTCRRAHAGGCPTAQQAHRHRASFVNEGKHDKTAQ
jgi:hypothetical protein